jgi:hypothetical protein
MAIHDLSQGEVPFDGWMTEEELALSKKYKDPLVRTRALVHYKE